MIDGSATELSCTRRSLRVATTVLLSLLSTAFELLLFLALWIAFKSLFHCSKISVLCSAISGGCNGFSFSDLRLSTKWLHETRNTIHRIFQVSASLGLAQDSPHIVITVTCSSLSSLIFLFEYLFCECTLITQQSTTTMNALWFRCIASFRWAQGKQQQEEEEEEEEEWS